MGFFYGFYFSLPAQLLKADTWDYFAQSKIETNWLLQNPKAFIADLFNNHYQSTGNLFTGSYSFWNDLKATFFIKTLAILNIFTNKNYYISILFFNLGFMFGGVAFFKLFNEHFKINKWLLLWAVFFIPTFLFWGSGIHKDGIVFSATAISIYLLNSILEKGVSFQRIALLLFCLALIFILKNYYLLAIIPAFCSWVITYKYSINPKLVFPIMIFFCLSIFISSNNFYLTKDISKSVVAKHNEFLTLEGNTKFETPNLENTTSSIVSYFPFAMQAATARPFISNVKSTAEMFIVIENYFIIALAVFALVFIFYKKRIFLNSPIIWSCITIVFFLLLFIGYTVCFEGAIVRYRSITLPFLIVPCLIILFGKLKPINKEKLISAN